MRHDFKDRVFFVQHPDNPNQQSVPVEFVAEGYWDELTGGSWMFADGNPAALKYAIRSAMQSLPFDNEVVYGHIGAFGHIMHVSELTEEA